MTGSFGTTDQDNGGIAATSSPQRNGLIGSNLATGQQASDFPGPPIVPGGNGVFGFSQTQGGSGVFGVNHDAKGIGVNAASQNGIGVFAQGGAFAGVFQGKVDVSQTLTVGVDVVLRNGDCAEEFDASIATIDPGTVVVLDDDGAVRPSNSAYDKRVAGVVSGAGDYRPALILDRQDSGNKRVPVSFLGKVYCKVDAAYGPVQVGDLLTTSPTLGHAMKVSDPLNAFGAVIGMALRPLQQGQGLIPMLVALR